LFLAEKQDIPLVFILNAACSAEKQDIPLVCILNAACSAEKQDIPLVFGLTDLMQHSSSKE
jgi:hypothetical protein